MWLDLRRGLSVSDRERPLVTGVNGPLMARQPRFASLGVLARMPVAQLDPVHETGARLFKRDRSCWKSGLRSARFTNADCRRPSVPPRKMAADPVQHSDQPVPVRMSAFLRHISIMHLLSLGYEPYDVRLRRLGRSPAGAVTSADGNEHGVSHCSVTLVSPGFTASGLQIGLQNSRLTCGSPQVSRPPGGCCPAVEIMSPRGNLQIRRIGQTVQDRPAAAVTSGAVP
jgi:hypothetical protein